MNERASKYRTQRRKDLLAELDSCKAWLETFERTFAAEYRKAFAQLLRAGERYDRARRLSEIEWDQLSLDGLEPDQVCDQIDTALADAKASLKALRDELE